MSWVWYPYWWYGYTPFDIYYMMPVFLQTMLLPYYYMMYLELLRAVIDAWKGVFESFGKALKQTTT